MEVIQQSSSNILQAVLCECRTQPCRLIVKAEDARPNARLVPSQRLRQQIREPSHIGLNSLSEILVTHPSVVRMRSKAMNGNNAGA